MVKKHITDSETLRAWADAFNAVADLKDATVEQARHYTMLDDWEWLEPYRELARAALGGIADHRIEAAQAMKQNALQALENFREEAKQHPGSRV